MDENELTKTELWTERIKDFYKSGLSRKEWCQKYQNIAINFQLLDKEAGKESS